MLPSLSGIPDLGSRSTKPLLKPTQLSVVVKTASYIDEIVRRNTKGKSTN
jgi:hypothetical protein